MFASVGTNIHIHTLARSRDADADADAEVAPIRLEAKEKKHKHTNYRRCTFFERTECSKRKKKLQTAFGSNERITYANFVVSHTRWENEREKKAEQRKKEGKKARNESALILPCIRLVHACTLLFAHKSQTISVQCYQILCCNAFFPSPSILIQYYVIIATDYLQRISADTQRKQSLTCWVRFGRFLMPSIARSDICRIISCQYLSLRNKHKTGCNFYATFEQN